MVWDGPEVDALTAASSASFGPGELQVLGLLLFTSLKLLP